MPASSGILLFPNTGVELIGDKDGANTIFTTPINFTQDGELNIIVMRNGQELFLGYDYVVEESGGIGTGFDTVIIRRPPRNFECLICHIYEAL